MISLLLALCIYQEPNYSDSVKIYKELYKKSTDSIMYYSYMLVKVSDKNLHTKYRKLEESFQDKSIFYFDRYYDCIEKLEKQEQEKRKKKFSET